MEIEKNFTHEESLHTFQHIITTAKENLEDDSFYFLL